MSMPTGDQPSVGADAVTSAVVAAQSPRRTGRARRWALPLGTGLLGLVLGAVAGAAGKPTPTPIVASPPKPVTVTVTVTQTVTPSAPRAAVGDGVHLVGTDLAPGVYRTADTMTKCSWTIRTPGTNGSDVIDSGNAAGGRPEVTLKAGQRFTSSGCGTWTRTG